MQTSLQTSRGLPLINANELTISAGDKVGYFDMANQNGPVWTVLSSYVDGYNNRMYQLEDAATAPPLIQNVQQNTINVRKVRVAPHVQHVFYAGLSIFIVGKHRFKELAYIKPSVLRRQNDSQIVLRLHTAQVNSKLQRAL